MADGKDRRPVKEMHEMSTHGSGTALRIMSFMLRNKPLK